jgi:dynein heavy chain
MPTEVGSSVSATFTSGGRSYSHVCGRILAYQINSHDGWLASIVGSNPGLEGAYMDGVSLTHGSPGSRQHIWSFVVAHSESATTVAICSCTNTNLNWPFMIPSFVGNNYFCDTGNANPSPSLNADDPLWDGEGCGPTSTCCEFNNPPWFCTTLPQPTTDDIEVRVIHDHASTDEDTIINLIDINIM